MTAGGDSGEPHERVIRRELVVIGASAGGVEALRQLAGALPVEFPAPIMIVLHVASSGKSVLPQILSRAGALPAAFARDGEPLRRGQIYVAPADCHMLVEDSHVRLTRGPRENGHRPAIDPLFRSAARAYGERLIGVVLSGLLDDGAGGLGFIKDSGGAAIVQAPEDAHFPGMPTAAIAATSVDRIVPVAEMVDALYELVEEPADPLAPERPQPEVSSETGGPALEEAVTRALSGPPSGLTCPECGGALWEHDNGEPVRYVCHVGHAFSLRTLVEEQGRALETTLWSALRALEERADMQRRLARRASAASARTRFTNGAREAEDHSRALREMLDAIGRLNVPAELEAS